MTEPFPEFSAEERRYYKLRNRLARRYSLPMTHAGMLAKVALARLAYRTDKTPENLDDWSVKAVKAKRFFYRRYGDKPQLNP